MEDDTLLYELESLELKVNAQCLNNKMQSLERLSHDLKEYDKIFLVIGEGKQMQPVLTAFCDAIIMHEQKKVLVLSSFHLDRGNEYSRLYKEISNQEVLALYQLYHLYEFSDRFFVLSANKMFGGLFNFLNLGLLNLEEFFIALLK